MMRRKPASGRMSVHKADDALETWIALGVVQSRVVLMVARPANHAETDPTLREARSTPD